MAKKRAFLLRIDPGVLDSLQRWAEDEFRSLNGQIEYIIRQALREAGRLPRLRHGTDSDSSTGDPSSP